MIGTTTVTTDAAGNASFNAVFSGQVVPVGDVVSATATDPYGNTSEFAQDVTAVAGTEPLQAESDTYATDENTTLTVPAPVSRPTTSRCSARSRRSSCRPRRTAR